MPLSCRHELDGAKTPQAASFSGMMPFVFAVFALAVERHKCARGKKKVGRPVDDVLPSFFFSFSHTVPDPSQTTRSTAGTPATKNAVDISSASRPDLVDHRAHEGGARKLRVLLSSWSSTLGDFEARYKSGALTPRKFCVDHKLGKIGISCRRSWFLSIFYSFSRFHGSKSKKDNSIYWEVNLWCPFRRPMCVCATCSGFPARKRSASGTRTGNIRHRGSGRSTLSVARRFHRTHRSWR